MKKLIILCSCILVCAHQLFAQTPTIDYTIVNLKGVIKKIDGKPLTKGQKVNVNDKLTFAKDAVMLIADATKTNNIVIEPSGATLTKTDIASPLSAFLVLAKKAPAVKDNQPALKTIKEVELFFKDKLFILGNEAHFILSETFNMDESHFFYVNGKFGTETLNKQLENKDSLLVISKSVLSDAAAKPINTEIEMLYLDVKAGDATPICKINIAFLDDPLLKPKLQHIVDLYSGSGTVKNDIPKEIAKYISQYYGKTHLENLKTWVAKNLKVI